MSFSVIGPERCKVSETFGKRATVARIPNDEDIMTATDRENAKAGMIADPRSHDIAVP
jgi:hypothetical protein